MIALTAFVVIVGGLQWWTMRGQLKIMQETLDAMKSSGNVATYQTWQAIGNMNWLARTMDEALKQGHIIRDASERQSKAALDSSISAFRLDQRAWIGFIGVTVSNIEIGSKPTFTQIIANTGKTPAMEVKARIDNVFSRAQQIFAPEYHDPPLAEHPSISVVMPNQRQDIRATSLIEWTEFNNTSVRNRDMILYIFGEVCYKDVFHHPHHATFCVRIPMMITHSDLMPIS